MEQDNMIYEDLNEKSTTFRWEELQTLLKEEVTLNEVVQRHQQSSIENLHKNFYEYYKNKVTMKETCDYNNKLIGVSCISTDNVPKFEIVENSERELLEAYEPAMKFLFLFRNNNEFMLNLIQSLSSEDMDSLVDLLCHFFYENIFSHSPDQEELLLLCYLLLEREIESLNTPSVASFLDRSFVGKLLKGFTRRQDIKSYLSMVLGDLILKMENMTDNFLGIEISRIYEHIKNKKVVETLSKSVNLEKSKKIFDMDRRAFLGDKVRKTTISKRQGSFVLQQSNSFKKSDTLSSELSVSISSSYHPHDTSSFYSKMVHSKLLLPPEIVNVDELFANEEAEEVNSDYLIDLTEDEIRFRFEKETTYEMKEFYLRQLKKIDEDKELFTNQRFLDNLSVYGQDSHIVLCIYKKNFEKIKYFIDQLFNNLLENESIIPYVIKCICHIIDILISKRFPDINFLEKNSFISEFVFGRLIMPILSNPDYNGIITSTVISMNTRKNMLNINKILKKIFRANFFDSVLETNYTIFNTYFIEIMPIITNFFNKLTKVKLPQKIETLINERFNVDDYNKVDMTSVLRRIQYNYFEEYPTDLLSVQGICFTVQELLIVIKTIRAKSENFLYDKALKKSFEKLEIQENFLLNKIRGSTTKKYYIILNDIYHPEKVLYLYPKQMRFTFANSRESTVNQSQQEDDQFILLRIKYCITTILRNLNLINSRVYCHLEESDRTEKFFTAISKVIQLEDYSDNLTNDKIPLGWYSLYLDSNLKYLREEYSKNNFDLLYNMLLDDANKNLSELNNKSNLIITKLGMKLRCAEKINELTKKDLQKVKQIEKFIRIEKFIETSKITVCVRSKTKDDDNCSIVISKPEQCIHRFHHLDKALEGKSDKKMSQSKERPEGHCESITEFIQLFQNFNEIKEDITYGDQRNKVYESLDTYLSIVNEQITKDPIFSNYTDDQIHDILEDLENYIIRKIYKKVFPEKEMEQDLNFYNQCLKMEWIKPSHLEINKKYLNERLWKIAIKYLNRMDLEKSPLDKLKCVQSAYKILNNCINFCSGKEEGAGVDDIVPILIYIIIKSTPKRIFSNMHYIKTFMNPNKFLATCGFLYTQIEMSTEFISSMNYKSLKISQEEFEKNVQEYSIETRRQNSLKILK